MKSGEFSGHSIDEAVFHGLMELGLSIDEVNIETLQSESKGLFGIGAKMARVRLTQRDPAEAETFQQELFQQALTEQDHPPRGDSRSGGSRSGGPRSGGPRSGGSRSGGSRDGSRRDDRPYRDDRRDYDRPRREDSHRDDMEPAAPQPEYDYQLPLGQEHPAGQFLSGLLEKMQIEGQVLAAEVEDGIRLRIDSPTKGLLIGRRGETLDAMQYLTSLCINRNRKHDKYLRVTIDTEDYRSKREETLRKLARRQASRVRSTGRSISMEPMNPYERRVLHASLQGNPYVTTHSEGEEPNRRVIITPK